MTWTSELISRKMLSGAYLLYYLRLGSQTCFMDASLDGDVTYHFGVTVTLTLGLVSRIIMFGAYILILFEVGIQNLVCGFILGWQSGAYHFESPCPLH